MKKDKFRNLVKSGIDNLCFEYLTKLQAKHSKSQNLEFSDQMQDYLVNQNTTVNGKKLLFLLRTRMFNVKSNFKHSYTDLLCSLCGQEEETQSHLLVCDEITQEVDFQNITAKYKISYNDIFGSPYKQTEAIKIWLVVQKVRDRKLKTKEMSDL